MEFTLYYRGELKANGKAKAKQELRRHFHFQLKNLWSQLPLSELNSYLKLDPPEGEFSIIKTTGNFNFAPLISEKLNLIAELKITMLRPEPPGSIITQSGDIDNRLKTLFDALRVPIKSEIPDNENASEFENPFFCLLEDDNLITKVQVDTDRLLDDCKNESEVVLLINVTTKVTRSRYANLGFG
jgi:hypothetical protein